jgi:hypothetical protein
MDLVSVQDALAFLRVRGQDAGADQIVLVFEVITKSAP